MVSKVKIVNCQHVDEESAQGWFMYSIGTDRRLLVCGDCHKIIVGTVVKDLIDDAIKNAAKTIMTKSAHSYGA